MGFPNGLGIILIFCGVSVNYKAVGPVIDVSDVIDVSNVTYVSYLKLIDNICGGGWDRLTVSLYIYFLSRTNNTGYGIDPCYVNSVKKSSVENAYLNDTTDTAQVSMFISICIIHLFLIMSNSAVLYFISI